jgi:regulator of sigma E protease
VDPGTGAEKMGIAAGDQIIAVNGSPITYFDEMQTALQQVKNQSVTLVRRRGRW